MIDVIYISASDFCDSVRDGTHDTPKQTNSGYKLVTSKHIKNGQINSNEGYFISEKDFLKINERSLVEQWDVLMSMIGTIGEAAIVKEQPDYAIKNVALFKCGDEQKAKWLYYYLCSPDGRGQLFGNQKGASQQFVSLTQLRNMQIPVRDNSMMKKITEILSAYDDLIENNQKQIKLLEEAAMRLYKEWFVNLRFPGHEIAKIVDGVPEGWSLSTIGKEASMLRRGISPKYNEKGKSIVINQKCIRQFMVNVEESRYQDKPFSEEMRLVDGDVVICSTGTGTLGRVGQIFGDLGECTFDSHVTLVRANGNLDKNYLGQALYFQQPYFENMGKGTTNQIELSKTSISSLPILIPAEKVLNDFESIVQKLREKMRGCAFTIEQLRQARDKLLPKLMSGEIEINPARGATA